MRQKLSVAFVALVLVMTGAVAARAAPEDDILAALAHWSAVYETATDASEMLALYDPNATFWGTASRTPMVGTEAIAPYFQAQFDNYTNRLHAFVDPVIRVFADGRVATATGLYRFTVTPVTGGGPIEVLYRFTLTYVLTDQGWLIVQHHSSQLPQ